MPSKIHSASIFGFDVHLVEVETDILNGISSMTIVGLGDTSVQESKERIRSAIKNSKLQYPRRKKTINLAPANLRKHGPVFDLPIALGLLMQSEQIPPNSLSDTLVIGELSLSGQLRRVPGALPVAAFAQKKGFKNIIIPAANEAEVSILENINVIPAPDLAFVVAHLYGRAQIKPREPQKLKSPDKTNEAYSWRFEDIRGHEYAKRALIVAAAGGHNILFYGPPGSGKTVLALSVQSILPNLNFEESIEVTKIYSIAGKLPAGQPLIYSPPFRAVHHTASLTSLVGGGTIPRPGEISLAHRGVLFMDELLEFSRSSLDCLRQPMEDGLINISRAAGSYMFPAKFILIAAANPCICGYLGDPFKPCICTPSQIQQYRKKLSGPILDRIDIICPVPRLGFEKISAPAAAETSDTIKKRMMMTRQIQHNRHLAPQTNGEMDNSSVRKFCTLNNESHRLLKDAFSKMNYSGRAYHRVLKVSRTIADIENSPEIEPHHLAEALQYRSKV